MIQRAVGLPNLNEYADPALLIHLAQTAEKAGWDGCFIWDHLAYREPPSPAADPQVVLGAIAATTPASASARCSHRSPGGGRRRSRARP